MSLLFKFNLVSLDIDINSVMHAVSCVHVRVFSTNSSQKCNATCTKANQAGYGPSATGSYMLYCTVMACMLLSVPG